MHCQAYSLRAREPTVLLLNILKLSEKTFGLGGVCLFCYFIQNVISYKTIVKNNKFANHKRNIRLENCVNTSIDNKGESGVWGGGKGRELGERQGNTIVWSKTYLKLAMLVQISTLSCKF